MSEKNSPAIALNGSYNKKVEIHPIYISKINSKCRKQTIFFIIQKKEKESWYYLSVKLICIVSWNNLKKQQPFLLPELPKFLEQFIITISYKTKFIDSTRFMKMSLSNHVDNFAEIIYQTLCKDCYCFLEYESVNDNLKNYKCLSCNKSYSIKIDEKIKR